MSQPFYTTTYGINVPKMPARKYFIALADAVAPIVPPAIPTPVDPLFRVPSEGYIWITATLDRYIRTSYKLEKRLDGSRELVYTGRDPLRLSLTLLTLDERDRDRIFSWQYLGKEITLLEYFEEDETRFDYYRVGPLEVRRWKILDVRAKTDPGDIQTGPYTIVIQESSFTDLPIDEPDSTFALFKYSFLIQRDPGGGVEDFYVPSAWDPTDAAGSQGLELVSDISRAVKINFSTTQIAFGNQIIEKKSRENIELKFNFRTPNLEEISILEWAKDNVQPIKIYEWAQYTDTSGLAGREFAIALDDVSAVYNSPAFGNADPIQPTAWRITELSYSQADMSKYLVSITVRELGVVTGP